jgi:soluble lytic murein transglycosylase-like protein
VSVEPALGAAASVAPAGALAASERMQQLQALIARVEQGPAGFAAALSAAQATPTSEQGAAAASAYATASAISATGAAAADLNGSTGVDATSAYPTSGQGAVQSALYTSPYATAAPTTLDAADLSGASASVTTAGSTVGAAGGAYGPLIEQAAARNGIDPAVLHGLIQQESGFDPNATSSAGALGLTQLMPGTAASLGVSEPLNPAQSIEGGARYLGELMRQFGGNTTDALAAYNAGPGAVQQYGGVPPYTETQQYVSKVLANAAAYRQSTTGAGTATALGELT